MRPRSPTRAAIRASAPRARAYRWPLRPFDRQHAIRGFFDDPRAEGVDESLEESFHFGVDICAPGGTPVFAVAPGIAYREPDSVSVANGGRVLGYWHVLAAVREHRRIRLQQLIGWVKRRWAHVHPAESVDGMYLNPLRPGGLEPCVDDTRPTIDSVLLLQRDRPVDPAHLSGTIDLVVDAYDTPPLAPPEPWADARVTPVLVGWRLLPGGEWGVVTDFRSVLLPSALFPLVHARGRRQNHGGRPGDYRFYLAQDWDSHLLPNGEYRVEVAVSDTARNTATAIGPITIANAA